MNRRGFIKLSALMMFAVLFLLNLNGCFLFDLPEYEESYVGDDGETYYVMNKNYFKFDIYNALEVVVSDTEKFILYDSNSEDDFEEGLGEWINGEISVPIGFYNEGKYNNRRHGNIIIQKEYGPYYRGDSQPYVAILNNNMEDPGLSWWASGVSRYRVNFCAEKEAVQYKTYTEENFNFAQYIPERKARIFYSNEQGTDAIYVSDEIGLRFNANTGEGIWTLKDQTYTVTAFVDKWEFTLSVWYDTKNERNGYKIFEAAGIELDESHAEYELTFRPDYCYDNTMFTLTKVSE